GRRYGHLQPAVRRNVYNSPHRSPGGPSPPRCYGFMAKAPYSAPAQALPHRMSRLFTEIRWILQVALCVFLVMSLVSYSRHDPSWTHAAQVDRIANWAGRVGAWTSDIALLLFGLSTYWWVVLLVRRIAANYRRLNVHGAIEEDSPRDGAWIAD